MSITNTGALPSAPITLPPIPAAAPVRLATVLPLPPLGPAETADLVFVVALPSDAAVGTVFTGSFAVQSGLGSYPLDLRFTAGTNVTGSLTVEVTDEVSRALPACPGSAMQRCGATRVPGAAG